MIIRKTLCLVGTGFLLAFGAMVLARRVTAQTSQPAWEWDFPQITAAVNKIRAGRDLTPKSWPGGARVAVALSFDMDTQESSLASGDATVQMLTRREYAARVGMPRIINTLEKYSVPATFFIPAVSGQLHPELVDAILRSPLHHEIGVHGWVHEPIQNLSPEEERKVTKEAFDYWTRRLGHKPVGIRTPSWTYSATTLSIIKELGFLYDSSLMSDDRPYEILDRLQPTGIVEIPVELITDDFVYFSHARSTPFLRVGDNEVLEIFESEFDVAYDEGTLFQLTMHPLISGHRSRILVLQRLIEHIKSKPGVWFATHEQVARIAKAQMH